MFLLFLVLALSAPGLQQGTEYFGPFMPVSNSTFQTVDPLPFIAVVVTLSGFGVAQNKTHRDTGISNCHSVLWGHLRNADAHTHDIIK